MSTKNRTLQNKSKQPRLSSSYIIPAHHVDGPEVTRFLQSLDPTQHSKERVLYSIGVKLLSETSNPAALDFISSLNLEPVKILNIPTNSYDLLGSTYQYLNSKTENLEKGSFYTSSQIAADMVSDLDFGNNQMIFDPACGSGAFLFGSNAGPHQLVGVDFDPIAVMVAKFNYFIKFPDAGPPNIFNEDFFAWNLQNKALKFDYVIGNPPYGANIDLSNIVGSQISSGESFSYFTEAGYFSLKPGGILRFLVPEALLNVKKHKDIRGFILNSCNLTRIKKYKQKFSGVMSDLYLIELTNTPGETTTFEEEYSTQIPTSMFSKFHNDVFVHLKKKDVEIIKHVTEQKTFDLSESVFGLGVVTGDNKTKISSVQSAGMECIYSGKEVSKYKLLSPKWFINFDRNELQQVAPDEIYRAPMKLVYKTISKSLIFAIEETGSLTTNSANIIIPKIPGYDAKTVMGFLNSDLYSYLHLKLFGGVNKIAKTNLQQLPFPAITSSQNDYIRSLVGKAMNDADDSELQDYIHKDIFKLDSFQIQHIQNSLKR